MEGQRREDFLFLNSPVFFDALLSHLRFDGLSSPKLTSELAKVCDLEEGECTLCWVGAFQSWPVPMLTNPTAKWKVMDGKDGVIKEGLYDAASLEVEGYKRPSDCLELLGACHGGRYKPLPGC